jgi:hypothetical protein
MQGKGPAAPSGAPASSSEPSEPEPKYRYQFFQTQNVVEIAVLAKNLGPDQVKVDFKETTLQVTINDTNGQQVPLPPPTYAGYSSSCGLDLLVRVLL